MRQGGGELALDLVGQFAGISQRERRIDGQRHLRVEPMTEAPRATPLGGRPWGARPAWRSGDGRRA